MSLGKGTLKGLKGVLVVIEHINPEIEEITSEEGYSLKDQIEENVQQQLEMNGIEVLTGDENMDNPESPYLYINIPVFICSDGIYGYNVTSNLTQSVFLEKDIENGYVVDNDYYGAVTCHYLSI